MFLQFLTWYIVVTICGLAALPLALRLFARLPGNGIVLARPLGILLIGYFFWMGYAVGILRNETGGAWLALLVVAVVSFALGKDHLRNWRSLDWRGALIGELLFLTTFAIWATVRAYDPAANHTEQPMDLMFMSGLWASPSFPPQDAWLSGYPISYYYGGYWLLVTVGRLAGIAPEIAYNLGQASWYGLLLSSCFALVYALLRMPARLFDGTSRALQRGGAAAGGLLAAAFVGLTGNVQSILEWLHAQGVNVDALARWAQVSGFPESAAVTNRWYIALGEWWWWRSSRVLADTGLTGGHQEVIAEFPAFSYVLGDNHPHVLAMPFVVLVIALALAWFLAPARDEEIAGWRAWLPVDLVLLIVTTICAGSLLWINTWDFPPYLLLLAVVVFTVATRRKVSRAVVAATIVAVGGVILFAPYFLTAQSQARGFNANLFNPTRLPQFLWVFLAGLLAFGALAMVAWRERPARSRTVLLSFLVLIGASAALLLAAYGLVSTVLKDQFAAANPLPAGATAYLPLFVERWQRAPWTLILTALLSSVAIALWLRRVGDEERTPTTFTLILAGIALLLALTPEVVFLRDNFGWRMNTIFKFYYQTWLLLGIAGSVGIALALERARSQPMAVVFAVPALALVSAGLVFPIAAAWSRTNGFSGEPTFDATAWIERASPSELAAARWLRDNAPSDSVVTQAKGHSYHAEDNRVATVSGRATLLGWDGHESQWRGEAFAEMANGRAYALEQIYRLADAATVSQLLERWNIDYVVIGPAERLAYELAPEDEQRLLAAMEPVFQDGDVMVLARRDSRQ